MSMQRLSATLYDDEVEFLDEISENRSQALREVIRFAHWDRLTTFKCWECSETFHAEEQAEYCPFCGEDRVRERVTKRGSGEKV